MKEVLPSIYQVNLTLSGFNPGSVNTYLIKTDSGYTSIDTGWDSPPSVQSFEAQLQEIGAHFSDINQVIVTHCHLDHMGLIARLKQTHNIQIYFHQDELELIKIRFTGGDNFLPLTDKFLLTHGFPLNELTPPEIQLPIPPNMDKVQADVLLRGGEEIPVGKYRFKVINTPGHTAGHIALYEPQEKFLFSGDILLPTIATNAAIHVQHIPYPLQQYLHSLSILRELDIKTVLPGHEDLFSNHRQRIDELFRAHEKKAGEIFRTFTDGNPKTAYKVSRIMAWSPRTKTNSWEKLTGWDKRFAVLQTVAHLESLRFNRKINLEIRNGINLYSLNQKPE